MPLKLVVVDDEPAVLNLIKSMVEPLGCEVLAFEDSRKAAERLESEKFDGVLLDVVMPHLNGFDLTKRIRRSSLNHEIPIVMLTGLTDVDTMRKGFSAGATCFLPKPVSPDRLYNLVKAMRGPMLREKRRHVRLPFRTAVKCRTGQFSQREFVSGSQTLSESGMLLGPSGGLAEGQNVELEFGMPNAKIRMRVRCVVVRTEPPDQIAVQFLELSPGDRELIQTYISGSVKL